MSEAQVLEAEAAEVPAADSAKPEFAVREVGLDELSAAELAGRARSQLGRMWDWFTAFRRTRPFWAAVWMIFGGYEILHMSMVEWQFVLSTGLDGFGGWLCGGGLIMCGLLVLVAPSQRYTAGIIGLALAMLSLVLSNLGGLFAGLLFGVIGGSLAVSWGPKKPKRAKDADAEVAAESTDEPAEEPAQEPAAELAAEVK